MQPSKHTSSPSSGAIWVLTTFFESVLQNALILFTAQKGVDFTKKKGPGALKAILLTSLQVSTRRYLSKRPQRCAKPAKWNRQIGFRQFGYRLCEPNNPQTAWTEQPSDRCPRRCLCTSTIHGNSPSMFNHVSKRQSSSASADQFRVWTVGVHNLDFTSKTFVHHVSPYVARRHPHIHKYTNYGHASFCFCPNRNRSSPSGQIFAKGVSQFDSARLSPPQARTHDTRWQSLFLLNLPPLSPSSLRRCGLDIFSDIFSDTMLSPWQTFTTFLYIFSI